MYSNNPIIVTLDSIAISIGNIPFPTVAIYSMKALATSALNSAYM
jgi:hypothetical protein